MTCDLENSKGNNFYSVPNKSALRETKKGRKIFSWHVCHLIKAHFCYYIKKEQTRFHVL